MTRSNENFQHSAAADIKTIDKDTCGEKSQWLFARRLLYFSRCTLYKSLLFSLYTINIHKYGSKCTEQLYDEHLLLNKRVYRTI